MNTFFRLGKAIECLNFTSYNFLDLQEDFDLFVKGLTDCQEGAYIKCGNEQDILKFAELCEKFNHKASFNLDDNGTVLVKVMKNETNKSN